MKFIFKIFVILTFFLIAVGTDVAVFADLYVKILAVNSTDKTKEKDLKHYLPRELTQEDILDVDELELEYDANMAAYFVHKKITLKAKETKTFRILIRDVWVITQEEVDKIVEQVDFSIETIKGTDYYDLGKKRRDALLERLDYIREQQYLYNDNIEKRIDQYRTYAEEINDIRDNSLSIKYWQSEVPFQDESKLVTFVVELQNPSPDVTVTIEPKHYLPSEVKPENIYDKGEFEVHYDSFLHQSYLVKEETLKPEEKKRYEISIVNIWNIPQADTDAIKKRAEENYRLLSNTNYKIPAKSLLVNINNKIEDIEVSQAKSKDINRTISGHKVNQERFKDAITDVKTMEEMLQSVTENIKFAKLESVLKKIKSLQSVVEISKSIFKRPQINTAWKIIAGIIIGVGVLTLVHFIYWARKSGDVKIKEDQQQTEDVQVKQEEKV